MLKNYLLGLTYYLSLLTGILLTLISIPVHAANEAVPSTLITYNSEHELLPKSSGEPLLTIYNNGSMRAVFPVYMKRRGVHQAQLNTATLQKLKTLLTENTLQQLNTNTLAESIELQQAEQEQIEGVNETFYAVMDSTTTIIEYPAAENGNNEVIEGNTLPMKQIVQKNLAITAKQYPNIIILQHANNLRSLLQKILDTTEWKEMGGES